MFNSFIQAGFECSTHITRAGTRLDLVNSTGHERYAEQDYLRLRQNGILTAREGLRWHLINSSPGVYDFSTVLPMLRASQQAGVQVIWDLCHFGWPGHLNVFGKEWIDAFAEFAGRFGKLLRSETSDVPFVAPVNEISFLSWGGGDIAYVNPFTCGRGNELKRQLVSGAIHASRALQSELSNVQLVSPEPVIHIIGDPNRPEDVTRAEEYRRSMFEAWDMLTGRTHADLGGDESLLGVIGINYYDKNQWWIYGGTISRGEPAYRPFREILQEVYDRYRRPMFIAETGTEDLKRVEWFAYISEEVRAAIAAGVPINGICLYPILNHPGWDDDRHCHNGLWDYPGPDGSRKIYQPLADEIRRQEQIRTNQPYDQRYFSHDA